MLYLNKKDCEAGPIRGSYASWWAPATSPDRQQSASKNITLKLVYPNQHGPLIKDINIQFQDQDSSSSHSTGQSHNEGDNVEEYNNLDMNSGDETNRTDDVAP